MAQNLDTIEFPSPDFVADSTDFHQPDNKVEAQSTGKIRVLLRQLLIPLVIWMILGFIAGFLIGLIKPH